MICLDITDTLEGGASVNAVVDYTVHGLVSGVFTNIAQGQLSNTDPSVLYTTAAAISIVSVVFVNTHTVPVTVNLYLDPANAGTPRRMIPKNLSLGIGYSMHFDGARCTILDASGGIVSGVNISDTAYAASWDGVTTIAPSKNAVYDAMVQANVIGLRVADSPTFTGVTAATFKMTTGAGAGLVATSDADGDISWAAGGGAPGGADTQVQFNDAGAFAGDGGLVWNNTAKELKVVKAAIGVTPGDYGVALDNTTAAGAGAQQYSPALRFRGRGWKTDGAGASQTVDFRAYVIPIQGVLAPTGKFTLESSIAGAAYVAALSIYSSGVIEILGAIQSTLSGGDARGIGAIDLQLTRTATTQVPSGDESAILGGHGNTVTATTSVIVVGSRSTITGGSVHFIGSGDSNIINGGSSAYSAIVNGQTCVITGHACFIGTGSYLTIANAYNVPNSAIVSGYWQKITMVPYAFIGSGFGGHCYLPGQHSHGGNAWADVYGTCQHSRVVGKIETTNATATDATLFNGSWVPITLWLNRTYQFTVRVSARQVGGSSGTIGDSGVWIYRGGIKVAATVGTTLLIGAVAEELKLLDAAAAGWTVACTADTTNGALTVTFTGEANKAVHVTVVVDFVEVG